MLGDILDRLTTDVGASVNVGLNVGEILGEILDRLTTDVGTPVNFGALGYANIPNEPLTHLLSYGDKDFPNDLNKNILELTLEFIHETCRFAQDRMIAC